MNMILGTQPIEHVSQLVMTFQVTPAAPIQAAPTATLTPKAVPAVTITENARVTQGNTSQRLRCFMTDRPNTKRKLPEPLTSFLNVQRTGTLMSCDTPVI
jgi:hypothetical protein